MFVGDGQEGRKIENEPDRCPGIYAVGTKTSEELCLYYGLASALVMPSDTETWGLVVNEAMASGLPVIVSKGCGCATSLVQDGKNG